MQQINLRKRRIKLPDGTWTDATEIGRDGRDGIDGVDGFSPTVSVEETTSGATITVTDKDGTKETELDVPKMVIDDVSTEENRTWSASHIAQRFGEVEMAKFPNVTIIGQPRIQNGQISNFSATDYCQFPFVVNFQGQPFQIDLEMTTGNDVSMQHNVLDSVFGLAFAVRQSRFVIALSTTGASWNIGEGIGTHVVTANTTYKVRMTWDGSQFVLSYSTDGGTTYITDIVKVLTEQPYPKQMFIGVSSDKQANFNGIVNLNYASLTISNKIVWTGMDDVGLATRADVSLSNIDELGVAKIVKSASTYVDEEIAEVVETQKVVDTKQNRTLDNLSAANAGFAFERVTDSEAKHTKDMPEGVLPWASVDSIGGKSLVWNQIALRNANTGTLTTNGITYKNNGYEAGTVINGTTTNNNAFCNILYNATDFFVEGHVYYMRSGHPDVSALCFRGNNRFPRTGNASSAIVAAPAPSETTTRDIFRIVAQPNIEFVDAVSRPALVDLTVTFGAGNEPTDINDPRIAQIESYIEMHPEYNPAEILSATSIAVESKGLDDSVKTTIDTKVLTDKYFPDGMLSAGGVRDRLDFENGVADTMVAKIVLDGSEDENWTVGRTSDGISYAQTTFLNGTLDISESETVVCAAYKPYSFAKRTEGWKKEKTIILAPASTGTALRLMDTSAVGETPSLIAWKQYLASNPVVFYAPLLNPVITPITETIDNIIPVEAGGTVSFISNLDAEGMEVDVPNTISYDVAQGKNYVKFTDYASSRKAGVLVSGSYSFVMSNGAPTARNMTQEMYKSAGTGHFMGKGTLENIKSDLTKRALTDTAQTTYTDAEKANACDTIGAQRNLDLKQILTTEYNLDSPGHIELNLDGFKNYVRVFIAIDGDNITSCSNYGRCYFYNAGTEVYMNAELGNSIASASNKTACIEFNIGEVPKCSKWTQAGDNGLIGVKNAYIYALARGSRSLSKLPIDKIELTTFVGKIYVSVWAC